MIIDLHTHTFLSDGTLLPVELVHRAEHAGYSAIGLTDHVDSSNLDSVLGKHLTLARETQGYVRIKILAGVELTHVPPKQIGKLTRKARSLGAALVVVHGETIAEPVEPGTNLAAIEAGVDILAHPGLISEEEIRLAAERGVCLEISARPSHGMANGRLASLAAGYEVKLVLNSDCHGPSELLSEENRRKVALGAGLKLVDLEKIDNNMRSLVVKSDRMTTFA